MKNLLTFLLGAAIAVGLIVLLEVRGGTTEVTRQVAVESVPNLDPRAIVVLEYLDRRQGVIAAVKWTRVAFAIGDGTLLLSAAHCVDDFQERSKQPISTDIVVISPYYGDVFGFEIVAVDREADLAILKAPWPAHPALTLASEAELAVAKELLIVSRPQAHHQIGRDIRTELLPVLRATRAKPNEAVQLKGTKQVVRGWSGSALLLPKTGEVVGVATQLRTLESRRALFWRSTRQDALGCGIGSIRALLRRYGLDAIAARRAPELEPIPGADRGFLLAMDYFEALHKHTPERLDESARGLARLRPHSVQVHLLAALAATVRAQDPNVSQDEFLGLARSNYEDALRADPNNAYAHAAYGDFLRRQGRKTEALAQSEAALAIDPNDRLALINRLSLLPPAQTKETAEWLIQIDPNDPFYWFYYSSSLLHLDKRQEALEAAQKAVELDPNGLFYGALADALAGLGRMDEAQRYYQRMTERCGCEQCWYKYAAFLVGHQPDRLEEARRALQEAESKAASGRVAQRDINTLKLRLLEKTAPAEAEAFARRLLDAAPDDAEYWWYLAAILRTREKYAEATQAAGKAVELDPNGPYRPRWANCLAKAGDLEAAEQVYDEMLERHPERPRYWYWYAEYLADYRPERVDEARAALEEVREFPASGRSWSVPVADLDELQARLDSKQATPR